VDGGDLVPLLDGVEEAEHALPQYGRGALVVVVQAVVSEQVSITGVQEQRCVLGYPGELSEASCPRSMMVSKPDCLA